MVANGALLVTGVTGWRLDRCTEQLGNLFTIQIVQPQHKLLLTLPLVPLTWIAASSSSFSTLNVQLQINFHNWFGAVHIHLIYSYMYVCPVIWLVNEQLGHFLNYTYRCHFWTLLLKPHFYHIMKLTGTFPAAANHSAFWKFSYCVLRIWLEISLNWMVFNVLMAFYKKHFLLSESYHDYKGKLHPSWCCNISKHKQVGILLIWIVKSNVSKVGSSSERNLFLSSKC